MMADDGVKQRNTVQRVHPLSSFLIFCSVIYNFINEAIIKAVKLGFSLFVYFLFVRIISRFSTGVNFHL
jgi:hypothetical protein